MMFAFAQGLSMGVSQNGGTQQPWVFLLKMISTWGVKWGYHTHMQILWSSNKTTCYSPIAFYNAFNCIFLMTSSWNMLGSFFSHVTVSTIIVNNLQMAYTSQGLKKHSHYFIWVVVSNMFYFHSSFGEDSHFDYVFSNGLVQPPTGQWLLNP